VNSIESGAEVKVVASDSDGDDKVSVINASRARADGDVIANATGMGIVYQTQMGDLALSDVAVSGSGDGSFDGIHAVHVVVEGGDADVTFAGMNAEKMRTWQMGEQKADTDSDDDLETKTLTEPAGYYAVTGLDTLGSDFDSATLSDARFPVTYSASALSDDSDVDVTVEETAEGKYPNYGYKVDAYYRLTVPQQYDLVHSGLSFTDTQKMPSDRYKTVEVAEGVGENTEFSDISSWSDVTSSYSSEGANVTLDSTVEPGKSYAVHYEYVVTDSNKDTMESDGPGGAPAGGGREGGNQGIIGSIMAVIASTLGALGLGKAAQRVRG